MRKNPSRLAELRRAAILDSSPERAYDEITRLLATSLSVPITMVNLLESADRAVAAAAAAVRSAIGAG